MLRMFNRSPSFRSGQNFPSKVPNGSYSMVLFTGLTLHSSLAYVDRADLPLALPLRSSQDES